MTQLTDTQRLILNAAAQRDNRNILPLPGSLRGGAAAKVVRALLARRLIAETVTDNRTEAAPALNGIWRNDKDGRAILLHITDHGLVAIGIEPELADSGPAGADEAKSAAARENATSKADSAPKARTPRTGTKQAKLIAILEAPYGATVVEIAEAIGWQHQSVRGAIAGALRKKLGLKVTSEKIEGRGRVYWLC